MLIVTQEYFNLFIRETSNMINVLNHLETIN